ncbi:hypothetical protein [Streptomyces sp. SCR1-8]
MKINFTHRYRPSYVTREENVPMPQAFHLKDLKRMWWRCVHLFAILGVLAASVVVAWMGLIQAGIAGTHGKLTVDYCYMEHPVSGKRHTSRSPDTFTCNGTFRADDGKVVADNAHVSGLAAEYPKGHTLSAQRSGNSVLPDDPSGALKMFLIASGLLLVEAFVVFWFVTKLDKNGMSLTDSWRSTKGTAGRVVVVGIAVIGVIGLAAGPLLAFALPG